MTKALILGISGQDGSYLSEFLLGKGYQIDGAVRDMHATPDPASAAWRRDVELLPWNPLDGHSIRDLLALRRPNEIYNLAAPSSGAGMFDDAMGQGEATGMAVTRILEAIRIVDPGIRFVQASSSELFGEPSCSPQTENTSFLPRSPYGAAKLYAHSMVRIYRQRYGLFACSAILFNHESPRRRLEFVSRKVTHAAASIKLGLSDKLQLGDLDARRDWGFAADYARAMWLMLQNAKAEDYVIATGKTHSVRELCECAFAHVGLDYRSYVREDLRERRPAETFALVGNPEKAKRELGWVAETGFDELIRMMVNADLKLLSGKSKAN